MLEILTAVPHALRDRKIFIPFFQQKACNYGGNTIECPVAQKVLFDPFSFKKKGVCLLPQRRPDGFADIRGSKKLAITAGIR